jgi:general secretion pathway protein I
VIERRVQAGFSLLEVLVAFSVLALSLGVLLQIFSTAMRGVDLAGQYSEAVLLAESRLASVGSAIPLEAGNYVGDDAGYRWQVSLAPYADPLSDANLTNPGAPEPLQVRVEVRWRDGERERSLALDSLRLARPPGPGL